MSGSSPNNTKRTPTPNPEELRDPWAIPQPGRTEVINVSSSSTPTALNPNQNNEDLISILTSPPPSDGRINYPCYVPMAVGGLLGAPGGAIFNKIGNAPALAGALQGSATMLVVSGVSCALLKSRNGSMFDPSYDRGIAYAAGGATWPLVGELYKRAWPTGAFVVPPLPARFVVNRCLATAVLTGAFGLVLDYFNIARPSRPNHEAIDAALRKEEQQIQQQQHK